MRPPALVLTAPGTNRDAEAAFALELAGAAPRIASVDEVIADRGLLHSARVLVIAGGFSYGDALGSGRLFALDLTVHLGDELRSFVDAGRPVLGICNGFQVLVRTGLLPGALGHNARGRFECRWVELAAGPASSVWTDGLTEPITCPVAHGEGRWVGDPAGAHIAFTYVAPDGKPAHLEHPYNPNGSTADVAGLCDATGLVLGLMPHPEDHVLPRQHPRARRRTTTGCALPLFQNGVRAC